MCLGVPMRVVEVREDETAVVESFGLKKLVRTQLVGEVDLGEYVMIHAGYAIEKIDQEEAAECLDLWRELLADDVTQTGGA